MRALVTAALNALDVGGLLVVPVAVVALLVVGELYLFLSAAGPDRS